MMKWGEEKGKYKGLSGKKLVEACCVNGVINWDCSYILMTGYESKSTSYPARISSMASRSSSAS